MWYRGQGKGPLLFGHSNLKYNTKQTKTELVYNKTSSNRLSLVIIIGYYRVLKINFYLLFVYIHKYEMIIIISWLHLQIFFVVRDIVAHYNEWRLTCVILKPFWNDFLIANLNLKILLCETTSWIQSNNNIAFQAPSNLDLFNVWSMMKISISTW